MSRTVLLIDASVRLSASASRPLTRRLAESLAGDNGRILRRDIGLKPPPPIAAAWLEAAAAPETARTPAEREALELSDQLISELRSACTLVVGLPIHRFSLPSGFLAWIEHVARPGVTFDHGPAGPIGRLKGKTAYLVVAADGTGAEARATRGFEDAQALLAGLGIERTIKVAGDRSPRRPWEAAPDLGLQIDALAARRAIRPHWREVEDRPAL